MLQYALAGLALGSIYAIVAAGLVVTYVSAGVLNLAFGAMAYVIARAYYWSHIQQGWSIWASAVLCLVVLAPLLGVVLWAVIFRFLRLRSPLVKVVSTIGLSVALPPLADLVFGRIAISQAPGLAPTPVHVFHLFGSVVDLDQVITYASVLVVVGLGTVVLRFTTVGLRMRALVESEALTSLSGVNPGWVSVGVWAVSALLAGLAGILIAPTNGLTSGAMATLMAVSLAAVIAAKLRSLPVAVAVALAIGVVTDVVQYWVSPQSVLSSALIPSIPFAFILAFLVIEIVRRQRSDEKSSAGGALDRALEISHGSDEMMSAGGTGRLWSLPTGSALAVLAVIAIVPLVSSGYWLGLVALAFALAIALLSYTLVTGEGGMIWLCQITFAGAGAIGSAQIVSLWHWPVMAAVVVMALVVTPFGIIIGLLTIRLGELYVAVVTLSLGLLMDTLVFAQGRFYNFGQGVVLDRPAFAASDRTFAYLALGVFLVLALVAVNLRRSTMGLALAAARSSPTAAATLGLRVATTKLLVAAFAAFVAAIGGGFLAMDANAAVPSTYATFSGLVWLAVLITLGVRSIPAVAIAGLSFTLVPALFQNYLPTTWAEVPTILFGLGAVMVALNPEGAVATHARQLQRLSSAAAGGVARRPAARRPTTSAVAEEGSSPAPLSAKGSAAAASSGHPWTLRDAAEQVSATRKGGAA